MRLDPLHFRFKISAFFEGKERLDRVILDFKIQWAFGLLMLFLFDNSKLKRLTITGILGLQSLIFPALRSSIRFRQVLAVSQFLASSIVFPHSDFTLFQLKVFLFQVRAKNSFLKVH